MKVIIFGEHYFSVPLSDLIIISQEVSQSAFKVCVKDSQGISRNHDPIAVDYAVIGGKYYRELVKALHPSIVANSKARSRIRDCCISRDVTTDSLCSLRLL